MSRLLLTQLLHHELTVAFFPIAKRPAAGASIRTWTTTARTNRLDRSKQPKKA